MQDNKSQFQKKLDRLFNHFDVYTEEALAKKLHTTRSAVSQWKFKKRLPEKIRIKYNKIIEGKGETINVKNKDIPIVKEDNKVEVGSDYIIELQKDKIDTQKAEIESLKKALEEKQAESTHWEACEYDFIVEVAISFKGVKLSRTIKSIDNFQPMVDHLGYTKKKLEELWCVGEQWVNFKDHPVESIIDEATKKEILKDSQRLPIVFNSLKNIIGNHYIPMPVIYIHKNGSRVSSISYNKINWRKMIVYSKVKFLTK